LSAPEGEAPSPIARRKRVLIIEDDIDHQGMYELALGGLYALILCADAEEALAKLEAESFDLVISDVALLGMSGFQILDWMRQTGRLASCPVVICSSRPDARAQSVARGAAEFVLKPWHRDALLALVAQLIDGRRPPGAA
jgi:twitching motility two-component system response regulator PilH